MSGTVAGIFLAPAAGQPVQALPAAELLAGRGIVGDRYFASEGTFSAKLESRGDADWELTLIEAEAIDRFGRDVGRAFGYGDFRRNIVTRDIGLNSLVSRRFCIAGVELEGIRLCEPCAHLAGMVDSRILPAMVGRGGLRARILTDGGIVVGDPIQVPPSLQRR